MSLFKGRVAGIALATLVLGVSASKANGEQGRFTLPFDAQWANVTLKAGDYIISVPLSTSWPQVIGLSGNGKTVYVMGGNEGIAPLSDENCLQIVTVNGIHAVREFRLGARGKSFTFNVSKAVRAQMATEKAAGKEVAVMVRH